MHIYGDFKNQREWLFLGKLARGRAGEGYTAAAQVHLLTAQNFPPEI